MSTEQPIDQHTFPSAIDAMRLVVDGAEPFAITPRVSALQYARWLDVPSPADDGVSFMQEAEAMIGAIANAVLGGDEEQDRFRLLWEDPAFGRPLLIETYEEFLRLYAGPRPTPAPGSSGSGSMTPGTPQSSTPGSSSPAAPASTPSQQTSGGS